MSVTFAHRVVVPAWILAVGFALLLGPALSLSVSLAAFVVGVFVVPALLLSGIMSFLVLPA